MGEVGGCGIRTECLHATAGLSCPSATSPRRSLTERVSVRWKTTNLSPSRTIHIVPERYVVFSLGVAVAAPAPLSLAASRRKSTPFSSVSSWKA